MYTHNGRIISINRAWTSDDGYQHPRNWSQLWGDEDMARWSLVFSADPVIVSFDNRFYWGVDNPKSLVDIDNVNAAGEPIIDPRTGEQGVTIGLKNQYIAQKKTEANALLHETDWYVVRAAEGGSAVPDAIATARAAVRTACAGIETKINNAANLDRFIELFQPKDNGDPSDMDCFPR